MKTDTANRRLRHVGRQPIGGKVILTPKDLALFAVLQRHGSLPTSYLHAFTAGAYNGHQKRLTKLYNERDTLHGGAYLERPWQQFQSFNARYQPVIYELTDAARLALADDDRRDRYAQPITGHYVHRFMTACITASIELAAVAAGFRFISQEEILRHPKCPESTRRSKNPLALPALSSTLIPDQLFGIEYDGKFRFYALEADRNHETIASRELAKNSYGRKIHAYAEVFASQSYRTMWGLPNLLVLTVTTNPAHMNGMIDYVKSVAPDTRPFLFKCKADFGRDWRVPGVMPDLVSEPWQRAGSAFSLSHA